MYSDLELTGKIKTSNPSVDRLLLNALWGQKGSFLDVRQTARSGTSVRLDG